jgi:hypothetical protein
MPIQPTGFDRAFSALNIPFSTRRQCNWDNYSTCNAILSGLCSKICAEAHLSNVRLIDAHSFCWIYSTLLKYESEGAKTKSSGHKDAGRKVGGREFSIIEMRQSVIWTVNNSNGQTVNKMVKNKELNMTPDELDKYIEELLDRRENRCNLTGIPLQFHGNQTDKNLIPSLDRVDSTGHYEKDNLQVVCRFINFWKGASNNEEFKGLLNLIRGIDE